MKALVVGDVHLCDYTPIKRLDNFLDAQFLKLEKIRDIAEERDVDIVFLLGDVFDRARPDLWLVNKAASLFGKFPCVIYSLVGNHDLQGCRDGVPGTALGNLFTSGTIRKLEGDMPLLDIPIRGIGHTREHTVELYASEIPRIILSHNLLTPQVAPFEHLLADDVLKVAKDCFIFAGDFHDPFEKYAPSTHARVINPGVLIRTSIAEKDTDPSVVYFEATSRDLVTSYRKISLGAPKGESIFNFALHEKTKENELNLKQFIDSITQTQFESQDIISLIRELGLKDNVGNTIIEEAVARIQVAKAHESKIYEATE